MRFQSTVLAVATATLSGVAVVSAQTIAAINGNKFLSPLQGQTVSNVTGLVTGKASTGIFMRSTSPDTDPATSESIFVFSRTVGSNVAKGDIISLSGTVSEYRSSPDYLYLTEISSPNNVQVISSGNTVTPVILGQPTTGLIGSRNTNPPTEVYTNLDNAGVFSVPNNQTQVSVVNPTLNPSMYGLDFWESLSGEYVTVQNPTVLDVPNSYGDVWVVGNWPVSGRNGRGGLTISVGDGNPEAILIQTPLDGSSNPLDSKLGDTLNDISGVITYAFGFYTIRPDTKVNVIASQTPALPPPTTLTQSGACKGLTISDYNVENLNATGANAQQLANQIVNFLKSPTILFLQEIQDNSGATDDGTVAANATLNNLIQKIQSAGGPAYSYAEVDPLNDSTGGEPGGNIRNAFLYNAKILRLRNPRQGGPRGVTRVTKTSDGPGLNFNPGFIAPFNAAFNGTRRPLVAHWEFLQGKNPFFTVNTHDTSKGGSSSLFGDARPPVNLGVDQRDAETKVTANFIKQILNMDSNARVIASGDWNEFKFVEPQTDFVSLSGLRDVDDIIGTSAAERYTYLFVQNSQALIHVYLSPAIASKAPKLNRIHVNTWNTYTGRASDHDPDVLKLNVCGP